MCRATQARVGVAISLLTSDLSKVLLVQRGRPPAQGMWSVPGGKLRLGEDLASAASRELEEETGFYVSTICTALHWSKSVTKRPQVPPQSFIQTTVTESIHGDAALPAFHYVLIHYSARSADEREPKAASDADDARWWRISELEEKAKNHPELFVPHLVEVVHRGREAQVQEVE